MLRSCQEGGEGWEGSSDEIMKDRDPRCGIDRSRSVMNGSSRCACTMNST